MPRPDGLPTIGLAMIVKNEAKTLPRLFASLGLKSAPKGQKGEIPEDAAVDHVVIVDTGSTDDTRPLARRYGCQVEWFRWIDDFSAARAASWEALPECDFALWADADDQIENAHMLRLIGANLPPHIAGTIHKYSYAFDPAGNVVTELWRERLIRRNFPQTWKLPIHEVLEVQGPLVFNHEVVWKHCIPPERAETHDPERNAKILKAHYEKGNRDPRTIGYLGTEYMGLGKPEDAIPLFQEYLAHPEAQFDEERTQIAHKLSIALRNIPEPDLEGSETAALHAIRLRPDWPDGYLDLAELAIGKREWESVLRFCERAESLDPPKTLLIINPLEYAYQPLLMRGVALGALGRLEEAWEVTQRAVAMTPYRDDLQRQAAAVSSELTRKKAAEHLLELREVLVRHDQNMAAHRLLQDAVPYFIRDDPMIAQARLDSREMTLHATDPALMAEYYGGNPLEAPFEHTGVEVEKAHEVFHRVKFLRGGLAEQAGSEKEPAHV